MSLNSAFKSGYSDSPVPARFRSKLSELELLVDCNILNDKSKLPFYKCSMNKARKFSEISFHEYLNIADKHKIIIDHIRVRMNNYDQIDSLSYMLNPYLKYVKYGHSVATDNASRWIRYGLKTREEMIPIVEESDKRLDQVIVDRFCEFTGITRREFFKILDKWYNPNLFEKDGDGVWHPKFKVGYG